MSYAIILAAVYVSDWNKRQKACLFFSQVLFGKPFVFDHKTIFALVSWILFAGLLIARWWVGLRGWAAIRWVLSAYVVLLLAYVGSRFVLEVVLQRA